MESQCFKVTIAGVNYPFRQFLSLVFSMLVVNIGWIVCGYISCNQIFLQRPGYQFSETLSVSLLNNDRREVGIAIHKGKVSSWIFSLNCVFTCCNFQLIYMYMPAAFVSRVWKISCVKLTNKDTFQQFLFSEHCQSSIAITSDHQNIYLGNQLLGHVEKNVLQRPPNEIPLGLVFHWTTIVWKWPYGGEQNILFTNVDSVSINQKSYSIFILKRISQKTLVYILIMYVTLEILFVFLGHGKQSYICI